MALFQKQLSRPLHLGDVYGAFQAIQEKCLACSGARNGDVKSCFASECALYPYRAGLAGIKKYTKEKSSKLSKQSTAEEIMLSQQTITQILQADIGDVIDLDGGKGKLVEREPMRDSRGFETFALLIQPEGGKKAEQPKEFILQSGAVNSSLCVVAGLLYSSGDRGLLLRWNAEYTLESGDKKTEGGLFFLHGTALEEDETTLSHWIGNGGAVLPDKMSTAMKKQLRDYLVKAQPALKAVSIEDLRERCARNGWEITVPGSKG